MGIGFLNNVDISALLAMVVPGALAGLTSGLIAGRLVEKAIAGTAGGAALSFLAITQLDWSDAPPLLFYSVLSVVSLIGALALIWVVARARGWVVRTSH